MFASGRHADAIILPCEIVQCMYQEVIKGKRKSDAFSYKRRLYFTCFKSIKYLKTNTKTKQVKTKQKRTGLNMSVYFANFKSVHERNKHYT